MVPRKQAFRRNLKTGKLAPSGNLGPSLAYSSQHRRVKSVPFGELPRRKRGRETNLFADCGVDSEAVRRLQGVDLAKTAAERARLAESYRGRNNQRCTRTSIKPSDT
jgi:hypothetical protein